jgi:hypothetical protein
MEKEEWEVRGHRWRSSLSAQCLYVAEEVIAMPASDELLPRERPHRVVRTVFRPRHVGSHSGGRRGARGGAGRRGGPWGASELLLKEELALGRGRTGAGELSSRSEQGIEREME